LERTRNDAAQKAGPLAHDLNAARDELQRAQQALHTLSPDEELKRAINPFGNDTKTPQPGN